MIQKQEQDEAMISSGESANAPKWCSLDIEVGISFYHSSLRTIVVVIEYSGKYSK